MTNKPKKKRIKPHPYKLLTTIGRLFVFDSIPRVHQNKNKNRKETNERERKNITKEQKKISQQNTQTLRAFFCNLAILNL